MNPLTNGSGTCLKRTNNAVDDLFENETSIKQIAFDRKIWAVLSILHYWGIESLKKEYLDEWSLPGKQPLDVNDWGTPEDLTTFIHNVKPYLVSDEKVLIDGEEYAPIFRTSEIKGLSTKTKLLYDNNGKSSWRYIINCIINTVFGFKVMRKRPTNRTTITDSLYPTDL